MAADTLLRPILLLGGYGGFGARIAQRLAAEGKEVIVAGRSLARATAFCEGKARLRPLAVDRESNLADLLRAERPFAVIDAAGPFQGSRYQVAEAALETGCHYLDIADAGDFVAGISALDRAARDRGLVLISGASSVPALSGAATRDLADCMDEVRAVEMAISASSRATAGESVMQAILSYVGKPIDLWSGRRWVKVTGWQELVRQDFEVTGSPALRGRLIAAAEVPDLVLLPGRLPGRPSVIFRAGAELAFQNLILWLLSWPVRWRWIRSLAPLGPLLRAAQRLVAFAGSDRSAMIVRLFGTKGGQRVERRWTLVAGNGDGPEIPALPAPILLDHIIAGRVAPGAVDAGPLLRLEDFEPAFRSLSIRHGSVEILQPPPLYKRVMGDRFAALSVPLQRIHDVLRNGGAHGKATVIRGRQPLARLVAWLVGFPPEGEHELHVAFEERRGVERWTRDFGGSRFRSRLRQRGSLLVECFGPLRFGFELPSDESGLRMHMVRWWLGPVPLPLFLAPRSEAREWAEQGRFCFDVPIALPLIGLVVHYRGWLGLGRNDAETTLPS